MALEIVPPFKLSSTTTIVPRASTITTITGNSGGLTINGGTSTTDSLTLVPNTADQTGNLNLNGLINIFSSQPTITASQNTLNYSPSYTNSASGSVNNYFLNYTPTLAVSLGAGSVTGNTILNLAPSITFNSGLAWISTVLKYGGSINSTANSGFANSFSGININPTISSSTASVSPIPVTSNFSSSPIFTGGNAAIGTTFDLGFLQNPTYSITGASSSMTVSASVGFKSNATFNANTSGSALTVSSRVGILINDPTYTSTGTVTVTENVGLRIADQSQTSGNRTVTTIKSIDLAQSKSSGTSVVWNIFGSGNAPSAILGSLMIGTTSAAATEALQVLNTALLGFPALSNGIMKFANSTNANITALQAGVATGNTTYVLPTADGTNGQVLTTNGSATTSWTTPVTSAVNILPTARKTADQSMNTQTTPQNDTELLKSVAANTTYVVEGMVFATSTSVAPDIKVAFTVPTGATMTIGYVAGESTATRADFLSVSGTAGGDIPIGANVVTCIKISGTVVVGSTAGNVQFQWSQFTSNGTNTTVKAGSFISVYPTSTFTTIRKPTDQTKANSTLIDDTSLTFAVNSNTNYVVEGMLFATSTSSTPDVKIAFTTPSGTTQALGYVAGEATSSRCDFLPTSGTAGGDIQIAANVVTSIKVSGTIAVGNTSGNLTLQWAQNVTNATVTTMKTGSFITIYSF